MRISRPSVGRRALLAATLLLAAITTARGGGAQTSPPPAGSSTLSGTFQVIWGDPRSEQDGEARRVLALFGDDGRFTTLEMSDAQAVPFGGVTAMNGRRVTLAGDRVAATSAEEGGAALRLRVRAVQRVETPGLSPSNRVTTMTARAAQAAGAAAAAAAATSRPYVTVLCKFPDFPDSMPGGDRSRFEQMISGPVTSVDHYWRENSEERINLAGSTVHGWYTLPQPRSYYIANNNGSLSANLARLADDCTRAADEEVYFPSYSGINLQFNTRLDCCSWGGSFSLNRDGVQRVYPMTWEASWAAYQMGTWAHEVGHSFGLPHSSGPYGRTYDSRWDVMSSSSWHRPAGSPVSYGTHTVSYHKDLLGWVPAQRKFIASAAESRVAIERSAMPGANTNYQMVQIPIASAPGQFYTVEARRRVGYDAPLFGDGVLISRVDLLRGEPSQVLDPDGNGNPNDAGALWTAGEVFLDRENELRVTVDSSVGNAYYVTILRGRVLALGRTGKRTTVVAGSGAVAADSVDVRLTPAGSWGAAGRAKWNAIAAPTGAGDRRLRWERRAAGMGPGLYVDTITVFATGGGALVNAATFLDTLEVLASPTLVAGLSAPGRADSAVAATRTDSVFVRPSGPGAESASWTAGESSAWITLTSPAGTGNGVLRWSWTTASLAPGLYVDTIRVQLAGGSTAQFVDSLRVLPAVVATSSARSHAVTSPEGSLAYADSTVLGFNDRWAAGAAWQASSKWRQPRRFIRIVTPGGVGNGVLRYVRDPGTLAPGTYVDTVFVQGLFVTRAAVVVDTLTIVAAPVVFALSDSSRADSVVTGLTQSADSVEVYLTGTGANTQTWTTTSRRGYVTLMSRDAFSPVGGGTGSGRLRWMRRPVGLPPGMYVDTLVVTAGTFQALVVDTMVVVPAPTVALDGARAVAGRRAALLVGQSARAADSAELRAELSFPTGSRPAWTATARRAWTAVETEAGAGSGRVRWAREPAGLGVGTYVDTITVRVAGLAGAVADVRIVDTLVVMPPLAAALDGGAGVLAARHAQALTGFAAGLRDSVALAFTGFGAADAAWTASAKRPWLRVSPATGAGAGYVRWERTAGSIPAGTHVDTITVESGGRVLAQIVDSFTVVGAPSATEVAEELLGASRLSPLVRQLVDQLGNRDGSYNLGDFLAYLDRTGAQVSAALMAKVLAESRTPTTSSPDIKP